MLDTRRLSRPRNDGERWSSVPRGGRVYFYRFPEGSLATKSRRVERQEIDGQ